VAAVAALLVLPGAIAACADILSIQEPIPMTTPESSIETDAITYEGGVPIDPFFPQCGNAPALAGDSFFVSVQGNAEDTCGSQKSPCNSVSLGVLRASAAERGTVVVSRGLYEETLVLAPNVTIQGGWDESFHWICDPEAVQIRAPNGSNTTVLGESIGSATLENLTVTSSDEPPSTPTIPSAGGISVYGVFLSGSSNVTLNSVVVVVGPAGNGAENGVAGAKGGGGPDSGCEAGGGDGGSGGPGTPGQQGSFGAKGYTPLVGGTGGTGTPGENSTNGACGGQPGQGGIGGGGGGSSIAVYLNDGATISSLNSMFQAGNGGNGGSGGFGGAGGTSGGPGAGKGGSGGRGGGGAGGDSYALIYGTGITGTQTHDTPLMFGMPGTGGPGGTMGQSGSAGGATE
jgi:hypothetical protein